jgi:hypothetical protein
VGADYFGNAAGNIPAMMQKVAHRLADKLPMPVSQAFVEHVMAHYSYEVITPRMLDFITK